MMAEYTSADHGLALSSCTAGLHLSLLALGVGPGDEVITTPMTFVATVNAIEYVGATALLVDIDPDTLLPRPEAAAAAVSSRTKAVVPVSFGGRPLDVEGYIDLAERLGLWIVEDAAHAIGGTAGGLPVGADRHPRYLTCFSFYPNKNVASAEGGAISLSDRVVAQRLRSLRLHGLDVDAWARYRDDRFRPSLAIDAGYKCNWTDLQAAIAIPQLARLEGFLATREYLAATYDRLLDGMPGVRRVDRGPHDLATRHALHLYQVRVASDHRDFVVARMRAAGLGAAVHYVGVNLHPRFAHLGDSAVPHSDAASEQLVSLPLHPGMSEDDVARVVGGLADALQSAQGRTPE
jgi:dTDP-4-amino-4,6-dideoxygalactose transaminase